MDDGERPTREGKNGGRLNAGPGPGRPKGSLSVTRHIREALAEKDERLAKRFAKQMIANAMGGNPRAITEVMARIDGPMPQRVEVDDVSELTNDELYARTAAAFGRVPEEGTAPPLSDSAADEPA